MTSLYTLRSAAAAVSDAAHDAEEQNDDRLAYDLARLVACSQSMFGSEVVAGPRTFALAANRFDEAYNVFRAWGYAPVADQRELLVRFGIQPWPRWRDEWIRLRAQHGLPPMNDNAIAAEYRAEVQRLRADAGPPRPKKKAAR